MLCSSLSLLDSLLAAVLEGFLSIESVGDGGYLLSPCWRSWNNCSYFRTFAIELPLAILGFVLVFATIRLPPLPSQTLSVDHPHYRKNRSEKISFDVYGAITLSLSITTLVFALSMGGNDVPWVHPVIPTLLSLSLLSFISFVIVEKHTFKTPLMPLQFIARRSLWPLFAVTFFKDMAVMTVR